jgi:ABC-type transport system involved in multi-copper enzyme maturation permease subunit
MMDSQVDIGGRKLPAALASGWLVSRLFFRVSLGRRRILWIALLLLVPLGLAVYWRITQQGSGLAFFDEMTAVIFLQLFALGLPLYLGISAIRDEIDDKTIVYLFARPLRRAVIVGGKIVSVALVVWFALTVDLALFYLITASADGLSAVAAGLFHLLEGIVVLALAVTAYTALFSLVGVLFNKPLIPAIMVGLGWEGIVSNLPGAFPKLTLMYYLKSLLGLAPEYDGMLSALIPPIQPAGFTDALATLLVSTVVLFVVSLVVGSRKEYRV